MHVGLNCIYPFYLLPAPLSPAALGRGLLRGAGRLRVSALWDPPVRLLSCRTAASLAQAHPVLAALQTPNELSSVRPGR